jgi:hypothetical protein
MSERDANMARRRRMAEAVRMVVTRRERAPRSPQMARNLKRLLWRYARLEKEREDTDVEE